TVDGEELLFFGILSPAENSRIAHVKDVFGNFTIVYYLVQVCELDIIFNFEKAYFILDEFLLAGEIQETSKKQVLKAIAAQDLIQEVF
ncbi:unnamed protein product, partial [Gongylonema pulchrum]|uniref:Clat_adaptor_s domain-containing protein n=1 Tax=Gongylonema pulchrum TaxID=637853 RepID=A0A183EBT4_9BILA